MFGKKRNSIEMEGNAGKLVFESANLSGSQLITMGSTADTQEAEMSGNIFLPFFRLDLHETECKLPIKMSGARCV